MLRGLGWNEARTVTRMTPPYCCLGPFRLYISHPIHPSDTCLHSDGQSSASCFPQLPIPSRRLPRRYVRGRTRTPATMRAAVQIHLQLPNQESPRGPPQSRKRPGPRPCRGVRGLRLPTRSVQQCPPTSTHPHLLAPTGSEPNPRSGKTLKRPPQGLPWRPCSIRAGLRAEATGQVQSCMANDCLPNKEFSESHCRKDRNHQPG